MIDKVKFSQLEILIGYSVPDIAQVCGFSLGL